MKLEFGYNFPIEVRNYPYPSTALAGKRILYLSDIHYHRLSRRRVQQHLELIRTVDPHLLLLGGDYIDTPFGLPCFQRLVESIHGIPALAIAGNHDRPYLRRLRTIVETAGLTWLHNNSTTLQLGDGSIRIDGTRPATDAPAGAPDHPSKPDISILCLHHPIDVRPFAHRYNLVFAGHLHGGQIVLWQTSKGLYPVRWRYRWNQLRLDYANCHYLISKGLGDTFPIRYNCRRDVILVTFEPKPNDR
ncbi:MAG TPA: metallophosphoesterase [Puia sp.]|nr:metallophosphoesterase [Puia sp.]